MCALCISGREWVFECVNVCVLRMSGCLSV